MSEQQDRSPDLIADLLSAFKNFDSSYRRHEVDAAVERQEEITPYLLAILEDVVRAPERYSDDPDRFDHIYALMILAYFRESRAHQLLVNIASLPHDVLFDMFGDMVTEDFGHMLLETCGGDLGLIESLLRNKEADDYARGAAADALAYAVVEGVASREMVMTILIGVFDGWKEEEEFRDCYQFIALRMLALQPVAVAEKVREAYEHGMIDGLYLNERTIEESVNFPNIRFSYLQHDILRREERGVHGRLGWWACFRENARVYSERDDSPRKPAKVNKAKQQKRKAQKQSRKKNRR
ncbi:MAG: DUF1186 family protein [Bacteroidia bacterium]|nr:DUF1186 family protein [Bacteroidia bacterium]